MKKFATPSILLAGLIALAGVAHAQTAAGAATLAVPSAAGAATLAIPSAAGAATLAVPSGAGAATLAVPSGEASTATQGAPDAKTSNSMASEAPALTTKTQIREDAQGRSRATATTQSPGRAGEASTMVNGTPNANPDAPTLTKSKSERKMEKELKKAESKRVRELAVMGHKGAQVGAEAGTPQNSPAGNASVFKGGTPQ